MSEVTLSVCGYDITVDFNYTKGTDDTLNEPGDPEELEIIAWWFDDEKQADELAENESLTSDELLGSYWLIESITEALWDFVRSYDASEEKIDDSNDYLYDTDDLDWDSCYTSHI